MISKMIRIAYPYLKFALYLLCITALVLGVINTETFDTFTKVLMIAVIGLMLTVIFYP